MSRLSSAILVASFLAAAQGLAADGHYDPQPPLQAVHGAVVALVVVAEDVKEAVQGQHVQLLGQATSQPARVALRRLHADHDVP